MPKIYSDTTYYECVKCGHVTSKEEWERGVPKLEKWEARELEKRGISSQGGNFKCPHCSYRVAKKMRPPLAKRVNAV